MDTTLLLNVALGAASITLAIVAIAVSFINRRRSQDNYEKTLETLTEVRATSDQVRYLVEGQLGVVLKPILQAFTNLVNRSVATPDQKREEIESLVTLVHTMREDDAFDPMFFWKIDPILGEVEGPNNTKLRLLTQNPASACDFGYADQPSDSPVYFTLQVEGRKLALRFSFRDATGKREFFRTQQALLEELFFEDVHPEPSVNYLGRTYFPLDAATPEEMAGKLLEVAGRLRPLLASEGILSD